MTSPAIDTLWYTRCPVPTPLGIADQLGWLSGAFAEKGIAIRSIADNPDPSIRISHFDHRLAFSFRQGGNVPPIWARSNGTGTRLVGISWTDEFQAIITLPQRGFSGLKDLSGKRFGAPKHTGGIVDFQRATAFKGLVSALSLEGLSVKDVEIVDVAAETPSILTGSGTPDLFGLKRRLPYSAELAALIRGDVDAVFVKGTQGISIANLFGAQTLAEFGFHSDPKVRVNSGSPRILTVDERFAAERPDLVATLIATIKRVGHWAETHPDDVRRYIAREAGASEEQVLAANGPDLHHYLGIGLQPDHVDAVRHYKDFLLEWGFITADFDIGNWIDRAPDLASQSDRRAA